jgi:hypothetical protein
VKRKDLPVVRLDQAELLIGIELGNGSHAHGVTLRGPGGSRPCSH